MEEHTARGNNAELLEQLGVEKRQCDHLLELVDVVVQSSNSVKGDIHVDAEGIRIGRSYRVSDGDQRVM